MRIVVYRERVQAGPDAMVVSIRSGRLHVMAALFCFVLIFGCSGSKVRQWRGDFDGLINDLRTLQLRSNGMPELKVFYSLCDKLHKHCLGWEYGWDLIRDLLCTSESPVVRAACAEVLGRTGKREETYILIRALEDPSSFVRSTANTALKRITKEDFGTDSLKWLDWWNKEKQNEM